VLYIRLCISKMFCDSFGIMYINMLAAAFGWFSMLFLLPGRPHTYLLSVSSFMLCALRSSFQYLQESSSKFVCQSGSRFQIGSAHGIFP
jgi:D-alanyl-lipoteichoic acid acyltransferase DltB (MBOAT superfamily)